MINEHQYRITKSQAQKFEAAIRELEKVGPAPNVKPALHQAQINALRSQLADLQDEVAEYKAVQEGKCPLPNLSQG